MRVVLLAYVYDKDGEDYFYQFKVNNQYLSSLEDKKVCFDEKTAELILKTLYPTKHDIADAFKKIFTEDILNRWVVKFGNRIGKRRLYLSFDFKEWIEYRIKLRKQTAGEVINAA